MQTSVRKRTTEKNGSKTDTESLWTKAMTAEAEWNDKDEFLDVIYWMRQILGFGIGILWGIIPLKGILGMLLFFLVNSLVVYFYYSSYQKVDEEEYGGLSEIMKEGLMTSFASFLVSWIILYSALHYV